MRGGVSPSAGSRGAQFCAQTPPSHSGIWGGGWVHRWVVQGGGKEGSKGNQGSLRDRSGLCVSCREWHLTHHRSLESHFGGERQGQCSRVAEAWGEKSPYKPSKPPRGFCGGRRFCAGPEMGNEQKPQRASAPRQLPASERDALRAEIIFLFQTKKTTSEALPCF